MSILSGTVSVGGVPLAAGTIYVFVHATGTYTGYDPTVLGGAFSVDIADDTYGLFVDTGASPPGGHVGGGNPPASTPFVVAGATSVAIEHNGTIWVVATPPEPEPTESGLTLARQELVEALGTSRVYQPGEPFSAPCIRIHPGAPWLGPSMLARGDRTQRWEVWAVAGKGDSRSNYKELETLVSTITLALDALPGWSGVIWDRPNPTDMGGTQYLAVRGIIETKKGV